MVYDWPGCYRDFIRGGIEKDYPDAYAVTVQGDCMAPFWGDGDILLVSPTVVPQPGGFVAVFTTTKDGQPEFLAKRLLRSIPFFNPGGTIPLVAVEMLNPRKRMGLELNYVEFVHAVVAVSTGGTEPFRLIHQEGGDPC